MKTRPDLNTLAKEVALSVKQPWAYLLCAEVKPIENRTWSLPEKYIGKKIYIHASTKNKVDGSCISHLLTKEQYKFLAFSKPNKQLDFCFLEHYNSAIIGYVVFSDCVINHTSIWAEKTPLYKNSMNPRKFKKMTGIKPIYNWVVSNAVLFDKPIENVKGRLSFWDCSNIIHSELDDDGKLVCLCNLGID